jgi:hypothetical protein
MHHFSSATGCIRSFFQIGIAWRRLHMRIIALVSMQCVPRACLAGHGSQHITIKPSSLVLRSLLPATRCHPRHVGAVATPMAMHSTSKNSFAAKNVQRTWLHGGWPTRSPPPPPPPAAPAAPPKCSGCGATLQSTDASSIGFVPHHVLQEATALRSARVTDTGKSTSSKRCKFTRIPPITMHDREYISLGRARRVVSQEREPAVVIKRVSRATHD